VDKAKASMSEQVDALLRRKVASGDKFPGMEMADEMAKALDAYQVFYVKGSLDDTEFLRTLEKLQTRGIKGDDVVLLSEENFTFQDEFFVVLKYMQKVTVKV
jgi:hypothetical protein